MRTNGREISRWLAIIGLGGVGMWVFAANSYYVITHPDGGWLGMVWGLGFLVVLAAPFTLAACFCFRRQYQGLLHVLGVVGAILVFGVLVSLPCHLHLFEYLERHLRETPWHLIVGLPVGLVCLFGPVYAAVWVVRVCLRLARRHTVRADELAPQ